MLVYLIELLQPQQPQSVYLTSFREVMYLWLNVKQAQPAGVELESTPAEPPLVPIGSECFLVKTFHNASSAVFAAQRHNYYEPGFILSCTPLSVCIIVVALGINLQLITQPTALSTCPLTLPPPYSHTTLLKHPPIHTHPYFATTRFRNPPFYKCVPYSVTQPHPPFYNYILFCKSITCFCTLHPP